MGKYACYMDESGDLGWRFDHPYQNGGSSRYLTLAAIITHERDKHRPERVMKRLRSYMEKNYGKDNIDSLEIKSTDLKSTDRDKFCQLFCSEAKKASKFMRVFSKTVNKINVEKRIFREDPNTLYNYMTSLCLIEKIAKLDEVILYADARTTSVDVKYGFNQYLLTKLAGDYDSNTKLTIAHKDSRSSKHVQCADIIANTIWRSHEYQRSSHFDSIKTFVTNGTLFF